jgi:hypothetical protein
MFDVFGTALHVGRHGAIVAMRSCGSWQRATWRKCNSAST